MTDSGSILQEYQKPTSGHFERIEDIWKERSQGRGCEKSKRQPLGESRSSTFLAQPALADWQPASVQSASSEVVSSGRRISPNSVCILSEYFTTLDRGAATGQSTLST